MTAATLRFAEKRETILDGAARLFNRRGIKAGTLAEVAASVGLATNSLTYYYRKKEDLVCACLQRSLAALNGVVADASTAPDLAGRVQSLVLGFLGVLADLAEQRRPELIFFGDMRALPQPQAEPVFAAYVEMYRGLRRLLRDGPSQASTAQRRALNARTHLVLGQLLWARAWLSRFEPTDYPRVANAMVDILLHGLAAPGQAWPTDGPPAPVLPSQSEATNVDELSDAYLRTATRLINDQGVGGASVERIAATLALTKGSFYHHHDTKHALVDACFERSFSLIRSVQLAALAQAGSGWAHLLLATLPLVALHDPALATSADKAPDKSAGPLLRLTAWTELPGALRWQKFSTMNRLGERYAGIITSGLLDGSIRVLDTAVAAQMISGLINSLAEIDHWVASEPTAPGAEPLADIFAKPLLTGLLAA